MPKPIFVLIHGAWHTPACYNPIRSFLSAHGYTSICPSLPSAAFAPPPNPLEEDIKTIRSVVLDLVAENDVVVVMHSYGGIPGGSALEGLDKESCKGRKIEGGVIRLVYVMAWMVDEGYVHSAGSRRRDDASGAIVVDREAGTMAITPAAAKSIFYQDLSESEAAHWTSLLLPQSVAVFRGTTSHAAWRHIPTTYVFCEGDTPEMMATAEQMIENVKATEGNRLEEVVRRDVGHSPILSQPEWLGGVLREAAGEVV